MTNPAVSMLKVWFICVAIYFLLPFQLVEKQLTIEGLTVLGLFLGAFFIGTAAIRPARLKVGLHQKIVFARTDRLLQVVSVIAVISLLIDLQSKDVFDLALSYELRSDQAAALMAGSASESSMWFQIAFLTYPASYAYLVRVIVFDRRPNLARLAAFGLLPVLMITLAIGGRAPMLYGIVVSLAALGARRTFMLRQYPGTTPRRLGPLAWLCAAMVAGGALYYFIAVFFARAETLGGASAMFTIAEEIWGIRFRGPMASLMFSTLGEDITYVIFIFTWYVVQGFPMGNILFTEYSGPMQLGVYGVDLASALVRRLDGELVASHFDTLQQLGTYGFLPSAFGSLYVDFWLFGLVICVIWGALCALVFQRIRAAKDSRWLLFAPFVTIGILFSLINTPIGFSNGLMTHVWLLVAFLAARQGAPIATRSTPVIARRTTSLGPSHHR